MTPHLVVSITGHGYGHVAQTAPILNLLHERMPDLRFTVRSEVSLPHLRSRIKVPFEHLPSPGDIGMAMTSALDVHVHRSRAAYREFHRNWDERIADEAKLLRELGADLVLSNVGYLALAGAQHAGIPNMALCSLNWFDIYRHYCGKDAIAEQIYRSYAGADAFLRVTPGMGMETLPNLTEVAPIATTGRNRREELHRLLGLSTNERLVLVSMGGVASRLPMEHWPHMDGVHWLVQESWQVQLADAIVLESLPMEFSDLLASCDALLCKPGYGSFVEAACCATPVLYVSRPDWPETPVLTEWLHQHALCREVSRKQIVCGHFAEDLSKLWSASPVAPPLADGAAQVCDWLTKRLPLQGD
jgi:hypothetical protein